MNESQQGRTSPQDEALLQRILSGEVSRNAHFEAFRDPTQRRIHRRAKLLRSLVKEAKEHLQFSQSYGRLRLVDGSLHLQLHNPHLQISRSTPVEHHEMKWLLQSHEMVCLVQRNPNQASFLQYFS